MKGAIPIAGVKTAAQADQNTGAAGWSLSELEMEELDMASHASVEYYKGFDLV